MCGIIGYIGFKEVFPILIQGLKRLEYRGYDSWGYTIISEKLCMRKEVGKINDISNFQFKSQKGNIGVAHTRWATHGEVNKKNAHPHFCCDETIAVVHNGIIENYQDLKSSLLKEGHYFASQTDSEVISHLIEKHYRKFKNLKKAVLATVNKIKGSYAFLAISSDEPDKIIAARKDSPLVIGIGKEGYFLASDTLAFIENTDQVIFLDNLEIAEATYRSLEIFNFKGNKIEKDITQVAWEIGDASKKEYAHHTLKEINEQPDTVKNALYQDPVKLRIFCNILKGAKKIFIVAAGSSFHSSLVARYIFSKIPKVYSETILASEFEQVYDWVDDTTVILSISQSGETADVLHAVEKAKKKGAKILSIVNAMGSSLERESSQTLYLNCGPEVGVAATKSFTAQLIVFYLLAFAMANRTIDINRLKRIRRDVTEVLKLENTIMEIAKKYSKSNDFYFIGRSLHHPIALEGALKLKELSYIHAEGLAAGELKHGTLALIDEMTPAVVLNARDNTYIETLNNALEMKARGAKIIGVSDQENEAYDEFIKIPTNESLFYPILEVIPLQILAYHVALLRGSDIDRPRNLAKSVTVK
jgi:glucosamine--fructose-6-phosphate aminotransferase (isomerizing)